MTRNVWIRRAGVAIVMVTVLAACSSTKSTTATGDTTGTSGAAAGGNAVTALAKAEAATQLAYKGTNRNVSSKSRPATKNKHIVVISAGQAASSSSVPSNGAVAAAKALGWQVDLYDAKLDPSNYAPLVRQAIAAHVNGIILDAIDCDQIQQPLQEAKAAHIATVGIYAFDCNDPKAGNQPTGLFSANINFGPKATNPDLFSESYGADQANYIIAKTQNKAKIIAITDPEFTVLYWTLQGFKNVIEASHGSEIVDTVSVTTQDLTDGQIVQKIQAAVLQHPEATWIKSPYTYVTTLGVAPALGANPHHVDVMGGEGFSDELNLIRQGKVTAVNVISSEWTGWAAADTMNSVFLGQKPADSGIGWTMVDAEHGLPASGEFIPPVDFKAEYMKAWGVSS